MLQHAEKAFPVNPPNTKEGYYYRMLFEKHFPQVSGRPNRSVSAADIFIAES
jgi:asparagine synthase (glutamine-hydrolysing)